MAMHEPRMNHATLLALFLVPSAPWRCNHGYLETHASSASVTAWRLCL
jgi:hypothetical protein